jgi:hypothetical protein
MNTSAAKLLTALSTLGVRTISFRVLSQGDARHHTTPLATLEEEDDGSGHRLARFSVPELFDVYSLPPRKGNYTLDVDHGLLSFDPPKARRTAETAPTAAKRWKPKITRRRHRSKPARAA